MLRGMSDIKYPDIEVELSGGDGNAMVIIARVSQAIRRAEGQAAASEFADEAMSGDYDNVLQTAMRWVDVS
jgi:hypothetical protein